MLAVDEVVGAAARARAAGATLADVAADLRPSSPEEFSLDLVRGLG
jgi:hypothetical protein